MNSRDRCTPTISGVGKNGLKRKSNILRGNIKGITKQDIRKLARRGGVYRISRLVHEEIRDVLKLFLKTVIHNAILYANHLNRNTITPNDIILALKHHGRTFRGFDLLF